MSILISIIIPCYNSVSTIEETLFSVLNQNYQNWEALIINDGSIDGTEKLIEKWTIQDSRFKYFKKENGGLASARNLGISQAKGSYILPLDSDNKIRPNFVSKAVDVMSNNDAVGVVYGNALRFGENTSEWIVGDFDKLKIMIDNYIDACALIRKDLFDKHGLYEENLPFQGHEDWEYWLRVVQSNYTFYYLNEITFDYRVTKNSMIHSFTENMILLNHEFIQKKHYKLYVSTSLEYYLNKKNVVDNYTTKHLISTIVSRLKKKSFELSFLKFKK